MKTTLDDCGGCCYSGIAAGIYFSQRMRMSYSYGILTDYPVKKNLKTKPQLFVQSEEAYQCVQSDE